jgi:hypothetical protein
MRSANIDFTRKDKGGASTGLQTVSVRLHPRCTTWSYDVIQLLTSLKMAAAITNYLIQENVSFSLGKYDLRPSLSKVISDWRFTILHKVQRMFRSSIFDVVFLIHYLLHR